ncbi:uncharacterized protein LOC123703972 [Colias croceus]|uniref:uncharacterized protein LOC123703972 n=1 Tax=Colias crocea TaxID=72248 RepID=UPI001E27BC09|nr:uncharacterized protein LOC123703972 [Colias croceus]XP_045508163.1 uncharacterized protein LOC123703972 [Colias croceus]
MDKLEVDPKLFITCRLCLEEMGQYQIVPSVQQQIRFCFDIDVDPFDGLPQLICRGCEAILTQFNSVKKKYQEKQNDLKADIKGCIINSTLSQQNVVTSTEQTESQPETKESTPLPKSFKLTLKRKQTIHDAKNNPDSECESCSSSYSIIKKSKTSRKWRKKYDKFFICRYCSSAYKDRKSNKHLEHHKSLLAKYSNLINNFSIVIPRIDKKLNLTGMENTVAIDRENILQQYNSDYSILYKLKSKYYSDVEKKSSPEPSDDDIVTKKKRNRLQLISESSNETVILEGSTKKDNGPQQNANNVFECVDIGDSSDSDDRGNDTKSNVNTALEDHLKLNIISHNIAACYKKFIHRIDSSENYKSNKDDLLQHKILSMGRKVINKKRFNCNGMLRYLENKHLAVHWNNKKLDLVYVRTKLKENRKVNEDAGWKSISAVTKVKENDSLNSLLEKVHTMDRHFSINNMSPSSSALPATLIQMVNDNNYNSHKLLNPNPVANPKQLPKKSNLLENQNVKMISGPFSSCSSELLHMPIITSTISLAELNTEEIQSVAEKRSEESSIEASTAQPFVPRIKVKPVSQLMPEKSSSNFIGSSFTQAAKWNVPVPENAQGKSNKHLPLEVPTSSNKPQTKENLLGNDYVIMHTVEIPNQKTSSPFLYLKNLLQIHNLILMNSNDVITSDFICLIKFKSIFNQDNKAGVTLCMALFSNAKQFCIKIKDVTSEIDIKSLPPHWQWEILQLFRGDIAERFLENAKKISKQLHDATIYFVSLLRTIVFRKN